MLEHKEMTFGMGTYNATRIKLIIFLLGCSFLCTYEFIDIFNFINVLQLTMFARNAYTIVDYVVRAHIDA